jgi:cell division protein FtsZ
MKGAKGLLISITGGKDLTLYEVDEAATRIREEVDSDANIIVGATFDESLDGIVRVSVVATGIDVALSAHHPANTRASVTTTVAAAPAPAPQAVAAASRLAELTQTLRVNTQRMAERAEPRTDQAHRAVAQALAVTSEPVETAPVTESAVEPSTTAIEEVTIRPMAPKPTLFAEQVEPVTEAAPALTELEKPFIPPQAERPALRAPRMPRIDELPVPAQNQIRARQGEAAEQAAPQKQRVSLLQRLASVGLGRREEEESEPRPVARPVAAARPAPQMPKAPPMPPLARVAEPRGAEPRGAEPMSEYAKRPAPRPAPQGLDQHGRQAPVNNSAEDDQLEIPAFLRRQAH